MTKRPEDRIQRPSLARIAGKLDELRIRSVVVATTMAYISARGTQVGPSQIDDRVLFSSLDLDSLDVMMLAEEISAGLELDLDLTALIDYPTVGQLVQYVRRLALGTDNATAVTGPRSEAATQAITTNIPSIISTGDAQGGRRPSVSIVSANHMFPRHGSSFQHDCVRIIPRRRWDVDVVHGVRFGAFLDSIEEFDPSPWSLSTGECELMDPQQRLLLELVAELALDPSDDEPQARHSYNFHGAGVFVGASSSEYEGLVCQKGLVERRLSPYNVTAGGIGVIPGRIAFHMSMNGPSLAIDTACSSSLVSLGVAVGMMESGTLTTSFACSCNVILDQRGFALFEAANMLARDGRCKTLDAEGDGFSRGEAISSFMLATKARAQGPEYMIHAVAINQDGRSSRLTAPSGPAQSALIADAMRNGDVSPADVESLLLHGTGTPLGDPIEIGAALRVYFASSSTPVVLSLSAPKTLLGHGEAAAGAVSLAAAIDVEGSLAFFPTIHLRKMNENIVRVWEHDAIRVNRAPGGIGVISKSKTQGIRRAVGISSFASQGTNCHAVISRSVNKDASGGSSELQLGHVPGRLPWRRQSFWVLSQMSSKIRLLPLTNIAMRFVVKPTLCDSYRLENPDGFLCSFFEASRSCCETIFEGLRWCMTGLAVSAAKGARGDATIRLRGEAIEATASDSPARVSATIALIMKKKGNQYERDNVSLNALTGGEVKPSPPGASTIAMFDSRVSASRNTFTVALSSSHGDDVSRYIRSIEAVYPPSEENHDLTRRDTEFTTSSLSGHCHLPGMELYGTILEPDDAELSPKIHICKSMQHYHAVMVDSTWENGHAASQPLGVSIGCCHVRCRLTRSLPPEDHTNMALSIVQQAVMMIERSGNPAITHTSGTHPIVVTTPLDQDVASCAPPGRPKDPQVYTFRRSMECIARSVCREISDFVLYRGEMSMRRGGIRRVDSLERSPKDKDTDMNAVSPPPLPVVISGGTGGLGMALCGLFRANWIPTLVWGRTGHVGNRSVFKVVASSDTSTAPLVIQKSVSGSREDERHSKEHLRLNLRGFRLVHASGVLRDAGIRNQSPSKVREMFTPKVRSTLLQIGISSEFGTPIMAAYAFSSVAALLHPAGSSTYGAVNAAMESVTVTAMRMGIESLAVQWGAWSSIGMVSTSDHVARAMKTLGVGMIKPLDGLYAFSSIISRRHTSPVIACVPFNQNPCFVKQEAREAGKEAGQALNLSVELPHVVKSTESRSDVEKVICQVLSVVLRRPIDSITESLLHYGADSMCAIDIQRALCEEFNVDLPPTMLYDYPTVEAMAAAIRAEADAFDLVGKIDATDRKVCCQNSEAIGIESMIIRSPGASDISVDCTAVAAHERWDVDELARETPRVRFGKYISDSDIFDSDLFKISAREAAIMDPQQRILLEDSFAVTNAPRGQDVGVIVGMSFWDYSTVLERFDSKSASHSQAMKLTGRNLSVASGRISFVHGYRGLSMTIDTACSSSLVAIHIARSTLNQQYSAPSQVIVGCAMLSLAPDVMRSLSLASMVSDEGRSRTLDQQADGYGRGEATSVLTMRRIMLSDVSARISTLLGVVNGSAVNQDGLSASLTAPNGPSQLDLIRKACLNAHIYATELNLHELHGTGTPLGDPIELTAVSKAQQDCSGANSLVGQCPLVLTATKTVFGHSEPVAGCIGIYSVLKQLIGVVRHPLLHLRSLSSLIQPVVEGGGARRAMVTSRSVAPLRFLPNALASISAFAFQGTNAHVIMESTGGPGHPLEGAVPCSNNQGIKSPLSAESTYRGQRHWFVDGIHSWLHPILGHDRQKAGRDVMTWLANPRAHVLHTMLQHRVFDKLILPGMAIFRIMSDTGALSMTPSPTRLTPSEVILSKAAIHLPVMLSGRGPMDLVVHTSKLSGKVTLSRPGGNDDGQVASGSIATAGQVLRNNKRICVRACYRMKRGARYALHWNGNIHAIHQVACIQLDDASNHEELVTEPAIEGLDAATHLAAYREASRGTHISVPASCASLDITWRRSSGPDRSKIAADVSCDDSFADVDPSQRMRSYNIRSPRYGERRLRSLHSKIIGTLKRKPIQYVAEQRQVNLPDTNNTDAGAAGSNRVDGHGSMGLKHCEIRWRNDPLRKGLMCHEYVKALCGQEGLMSLNVNDPLLEGQLGVASNELGISLPSERNRVMRSLDRHEKFINLPDTSEFAAGFVLRVIVGGTSGIGQALAGWMAARTGPGSAGPPAIIVGRSGLLDSSSLTSVLTQGSCIATSLDCSKRTAGRALVALCVGGAVTPTCSIIHTAGIVVDESFVQSSLKSWRAVFSPKYGGFRSITAYMSSMPVKDILSTSSASIDISNKGQANYISANLAMEGESNFLVRAGIPSRFIRFGPWKGLGMLSGRRGHKTSARLSRMGMSLMTPSEGILAAAAFTRTSILSCGFATIGIIDWDEVDKLRSGRVQIAHGDQDAHPAGQKRKVSPPPNTSFEERREYIVKIIQEVAGGEKDFSGLDSLSSMEVRNRLSAALGASLPPTLLFDYPMVDKLMDHLIRRFAPGAIAENEGTPEAALHTTQNETNRAAVHVHRVAQMVPSGSNTSFEAISDVLMSQKNLQRPVPLDRWDNDSRFSVSGGGQSIYTSFATFVDNLWIFDADLFGMKPQDARNTDPQARCLLSTTLAASSDAWHGGSVQLSDGGGVFVGSMFYDYLRMFELPNQGLDPSAVLGNGSPYLSGRLAYAFNMIGPCVGIDTACSSSLVAVHCGRREIDNGSISYAATCGSNAIILPQTSALICQLGALSRTGRCLSLDATADGYGRGEAFVTCILSKYMDEDTLAVLRGTAVNQDGRSISLTAPNGPSQERLIKSCLSDNGILMNDVHSISIHGTGTLLGDPLETQALSNVFNANPGGLPVAVSANKALLGHCEGAAGTTGLLNALLNIHKHYSNGVHTLRDMNPYLVLARLMPRRSSGPIPGFSSLQSAGTSSFGMSGTNSHAILTGGRQGHENENIRGVWRHNCVSTTREQVYRQSGPMGRWTFVNEPNAISHLFHIQYTQSQSTALSDHRVRLGRNGLRPLLPAATQIHLIASATRELLSNEHREILHGIIFVRPSIFVENAHGTLIEMDAVRGTAKLRDAHVAGLPTAHAAASIAVNAPIPDRNLVGTSSSNFFTNDQRGTGLGNPRLEVAKRNTARVCAGTNGGAPSSMMDAALHLAVVGECCVTQQVPVSCGAVFSDSSSLSRSHRKSVWATDHQLESAGIMCTLRPPPRAFYASGLESRPLNGSTSVESFSIWTGCLVDPVGKGYSVPAMPLPCLGGEANIEAHLRLIQLLQHDRADDRSISNSHPVVTQALHRVHANETGTWSPEAEDDSFLVPSTVGSTWESERSLVQAASSEVLLTSLGGIGLLVAVYHADHATIVRACCRSPSARRNFNRHLDVHAVSSPPRAAIAISNCDMSQREDSNTVMSPSVGTIIQHTAGTLRDALIRNVTSTDISTTLAPKIGILRNISEVLGCSAVRYMCSYSSISSIFGTRGQATYVMANAAMDACVHSTWSRGLPCFTIQWGLWEQQKAGMAASLDHNTSKKLETLGFLRLSPVEGLGHVERHLAQAPWDVPSVMVSKMLDVKREKGSMPVSSSKEDQISGKHRRMDEVSVIEALRKVFHHTLGQAVDELVPVLQQGLDSISSVEFTQSLEKELGVRLPLTLVYDYPLPEDMVAYIQGQRGVGLDSAGETARALHIANVTPPDTRRKDVAVVSHSSKLPATAIGDGQQTPFNVDNSGLLCRGPFHSLNAFASAFDSHELYAFDADMFRMGYEVAISLDPNIRWLLALQVDLLEEGQRAISRPHPPLLSQVQPVSPINTEDTGVFLGWMWSDEHAMRSDISPKSVTGTSAPFAVGYVAYVMQMCGPCVPIDTACSSSLVALHLAKAALDNGDCSFASVNGINAFLCLDTWHKIRSISAESRDGRCKSLDSTADGYGRGEGFVSMLIQTQSIHNSTSAILAGSACSTAGRRSALTAPNGPSQTAVVQEALQRAGRPCLDSVALHGTGTALGDPIEIRSLLTSLPASQTFRLVSPKSAVGHTEGSAGLTNCLSAISMASQQQTAPIQNLRGLNPFLLGDIYGFVPRQVAPAHCGRGEAGRVPPGHTTGCSSFGMSGVNAHVVFTGVIEEFAPRFRHTAVDGGTRVLTRPSDQHALVPKIIVNDSRQRRPLVRWHFVPTMDKSCVSWMADHRVKGSSIIPGTFFLAICGMSVVNSDILFAPPILHGNSWMRAVEVGELMDIAAVFSPNGTITCGLANQAPVFTTSITKLTTTITPRHSTTRIWPLPHLCRSSISIYGVFPLTHARKDMGETTSRIIARITPTRTLTGDTGLRAAPRVDAALHLTATATTVQGKLFVPLTLGAYLEKKGNRDDSRDEQGNFTSSLWPAVDDARCTVGSSFSGDMKLLELVAANFRVGRSEKVDTRIKPAGNATGSMISGEIEVVDHVANLSYTFETAVDAPLLRRKDSYSRYGGECLQEERDGIRAHGSSSAMVVRVSVDASSFAAHVAALQCIPHKARVELVGAYAPRTRVLINTYQSETGDKQAITPTDEGRTLCTAGPTCGRASFQQAIFPMPGIRCDSFPMHFAADTLNKDSKMIQVKVEAVALNFRDFLVAMGMYPTAVDQASMGSDFAGTIVGIGTLQNGMYHIGDAVFGQSKGVFKERICLESGLLVPVPVGAFSPEDAATLPTVFLTAIRCIKCIEERGQMGSKSILLHATSGGLGLALAQVARVHNLRVVGTAGSTFKRRYLRGRGIALVSNSRDLAFVDDISSLHDEEKIGGVINTLTSPGMISASMSIVSTGGHFVEVSKRDIFSHARVLQDRPDLHFNIVAVDLMPAEALAGDLTEIASMLAAGDITPIPKATYSLSQLSQAMGRFKSSRAIGKTVCSRCLEGPLGRRERTKWLVTGGAGALGRLSCSLLVESGHVDLVLPLRRMQNFAPMNGDGKGSEQPPGPGSKIQSTMSSIGSLCTTSAMVQLVLANAADRSAFAFLATTKVDGMIHSSGVLRDGLIPGIRTLRPSNEVFAAKSAPILGHFGGNSGSFMSSVSLTVSFSSISSVFPNPGQGNYAWANSILDEAAEVDAQRGRRHVVINWGPWAGGGMAAHLDERSLNGIQMIHPSIGATAMEGILCGSSFSAVRVLCVAMSASRRKALMEESVDDVQKSTSKAPKAIERSKPMSPIWDRAGIKSTIEDMVTGLLDDNHRDALSSAMPLMQAGLDSLGAIELVSKLKNVFGVPFSPTFLFDFPTIDGMVEHIVLAVKVESNAGSVAVYGDADQIQGNPNTSLNQFSNRRIIRVLDSVAALPAVRPVPFNRWDIDRGTSVRGTPRFGGFVADHCVERFAPELFSISTKESAVMDPQHRILMMQVLAVRGEHTRNTSVAVGIGRLEDPWHTLSVTESLIREGNGLVSTSRAASASAGRISYHFDFRGECFAIDTACSSSLVALHVLYQALTSGSESSTHGFLCGVNLTMSERTSAMLGASAMLAVDGRCKTLDQSADGYGRSEGSSVLKLSSKDSEGNKSPIFVLGTAVNQDGRSAALTAPNGPAQEAVMRAAGAGTGFRVHIIGMHGTGTPLGDPIEVNSLQGALGRGVQNTTQRAVSLFASKSTLGHAETASGIIGLVANIRMSLNLSINGFPTLRRLNRHVIGSISQESMLTSVPRLQGPRVVEDSHGGSESTLSCVNAFAFQGSNASIKMSCGLILDTPRPQILATILSRITQLPRGHPLVTRIRLSRGISFECSIMHPSLHLQDHRVSGKPVFPASGYLELMEAATEALVTGGDIGRKRFMHGYVTYKNPYVMRVEDFALHVTVEAGSGRTTVRDPALELCTATTMNAVTMRMPGANNDGAFWTKQSFLQCCDVRASTRPLSSLIMVQQEPAAAVAQTSIHDMHVVHGLDSAWHLCAFFVAWEEKIKGVPALRIPRTLEAFARCALNDSSGVVPNSHQCVDISLSKPASGLFTASSNIFNAIHLYIDRIAKLPRTTTDSAHGSSSGLAPPAAILYGINPHRVVHSEFPGKDIPNTCKTSSFDVQISESADVGCLLGALQQGVIPDCSARTNKALRASVDALNRVRESGVVVDPYHFRHEMRLESLDERREIDICVDQWTTVLVTGGKGAVGSLVRQFISVMEPSAHIISLSRSYMASGDAQNGETMGMEHTSVVSGDTALDGLGALGLCTSDNRPVKTVVINAAGVLIDQLLHMVNMRSSRGVFAPKSAGTQALMRAVNALPATLLHCGSIAAVLGNEGQATYILANSILAALSKIMGSQGIESSVIHFGPLATLTGMASSAAVRRSLERRRVPLLAPIDVLRVVRHALVERLSRQYSEYIAFDYPGYLVSAPERDAVPHSTTTSRPANEVSGTCNAAGARPEHVNQEPETGEGTVAKVWDIVCHLVDRQRPNEGPGMTEGVDVHTKFVDFGLDSLAAVEFAEALGQRFKMQFSATVLFDHPTIADLAGHIDDVIGVSSSSQSHFKAIFVPGGAAQEPYNGSMGSTAIISAAYRFPDNQSGNGKSCYANPLSCWLAGDEIQSLVPPSRWDIDTLYSPNQTHGMIYVRIGGWLRDVEMFDPAAFGMSYDEAITMDPQLRLLLELTDELVLPSSDACRPLNSTSNFVGCMYQEYLDGVLRGSGVADTVPSAITSTGMSFLVGRLSYHYNLRGQSIACDTACSSSLVGVHLAREALLRSTELGERALAHGVNMMLSPQTTSRICLIQALSPVGRCKTADYTADGYGRSESGMSVLLGIPGRSSDEQEGTLAVLLGSGIRHNGTTGGISAPHGPSQTRLIADVWREAGEGTHYCASLHGTGTSLGDPIEFQAIQSVWGQTRKGTGYKQATTEHSAGECSPGARPVLGTKAWAGHMEGTAGLVGLLLPMLESTLIAPMCHLRHLNEHIARQGLEDMFVSRQAAPRPPSNVASSSFGMGGTNAHAAARVVDPGCDYKILPPKYDRKRCWPLVRPCLLPSLLRKATTKAVYLEMASRHAFWMSSHVVNGRKLIAGASMLTILADAVDVMEMLRSRKQDGHCALTSVTFLAAADLGHILGISLGIVPGDSLLASLSVAGARVCTASCDRVAQVGRSDKSCVYHVSRSKYGQRAPLVSLDDLQPAANLGFIDRRQHGRDVTLSPCVTDAAMHLGLASSDEGRIPVSISAFERDNECVDARMTTVSCLVDGVNDRMRAASQAPRATLVEVRSKQSRALAEKATRAELRACVDIFTPIGNVDKTDYGPSIRSGSITVGSTTFTARPVEFWHGPLSVASQTVREQSSSTIIADPTIPMGAAILTVAGKEHPRLKTNPDIARSKEYTGLPVKAQFRGGRGRNSTWINGEARHFNLVTGAFGGIGTVVAHWLVIQGSPTILLGRKVHVRTIGSKSRYAVLMQCDTSSTDDVSHVLRSADPRSTPHYALHHAAGSVRDAMVHRVSPVDVRETIAGKYGPFSARSDIFEFTSVTSGIRTSLFYSSITGVIGNRGQLAYTYANDLLNRLAVSHCGRGLVAISIAWGAWAGRGMAVGMEAALADSGVRIMRPDVGLHVLEMLSSTTAIQISYAWFSVIVAGAFDDLDALLGGIDTHQEEMLEAMEAPGTEGGSTPDRSETELGSSFGKNTDPQSLHPDTIARIVNSVLQDTIGGNTIDENASILIHLDSLAAVELVDKLSRGLGVVLAPTLLYDYPSVKLLVDHLIDTFGLEGENARPSLSTEEGSAGLDNDQLKEPQESPRRHFTLREDYYCSPSIEELERMEDDQIQNVSNFVIGRQGYGEIRFLSSVDLSDVDLEAEVSIGKRGMMVSDGASPGERLNHPALMCFQAPVMKTAALRRRLRSVLAKTLRDSGPSLVFLDEETGFMVLFVEDWF